MLEEWDRADPLVPFRNRFDLPHGLIYLDGNSLGPLPRATPARLASVIADEWGRGLIRSWNDAGWIDLAGRVGDKIARLVGAPPGSVMVADSTSLNLFKLLGAALAERPDRRAILSQPDNFPSDLYIADGLARLLARGHRLQLMPAEAIIPAIGADTAVVMLTQVNYRTGELLDMAAITAAAHAAGALVLWDLAHSAGALPVALAACDADYAIGCGYKFLNGGPGAPAFLYVAPRLQGSLRMPITGWLGHASPFAFEPDFRPAAGIAAAAVGTPPVLSLAALEVGVDLALEAPLSEVRKKSVRLGILLERLFTEHCPALDPGSPADPDRRGSQLCVRHAAADSIMQALIARGVIGDMRAPDVLRFGLTPLYLSYVDIWDAVHILADVMRSGSYRERRFSLARTVT